MIDVQSEEYKLGKSIRKYRMAKHWTQADLSRGVDIDRADISKYESGTKGEMGFKTLKKFAQALGVTTEQLLYDEDEPTEISGTYQLLSAANQLLIHQMLETLLAKQILQN